MIKYSEVTAWARRVVVVVELEVVEEAVFTRESIPNEDPSNAQQAQHRPSSSRRRLSLLVKIEGDPLNTQHAQHRHKP